MQGVPAVHGPARASVHGSAKGAEGRCKGTGLPLAGLRLGMKETNTKRYRGMR